MAGGDVYLQLVSDATRLQKFYSKHLELVKTIYSAYGGKFLAFSLVMKHFRHMLEERQFSISTDHKPINLTILSNYDWYTCGEKWQFDYIA